MNFKKEVFLTCKDYTVSNKKFDLLYNQELDMLETYPQPKNDELGLYYESSDYISHTDAKKTIIDKLYFLVKKITLNQKLKLINSFNQPQKKLLDVGCGTGDFLITCKKNNWQVTGVEPNLNARNLIHKKNSETNRFNVFENINDINEAQFNIITLWHVLEHIPNLDEYISKLKCLLKTDGVLIVAVPNFKSYDASYYKQFWAAYDVPRHLWHFSKKSIEILFSKHKIKLVKTLPMKFDSYYVSLLSEKYKTGKSNFFKAFYIGLLSNLKAIVSKSYSSQIYILKNS